MKLPLTREQERDEFIRRYREEYDIPFGPMGWMEQAFLEANLFAHMQFMERVFFGSTATGVPCTGWLDPT